MRLRKLFAALIAVLATFGLVSTSVPAQAVGGGNVSIWWDFNGGPTKAYNLTFPITIGAGTAHWDGTYFAQQFNFTGTGPVAYTGLQPMADRPNGTPQMRAIFSSFDGNSTSNHRNCSDGADGGGGTTCRVVIRGGYGHKFHMQIRRVAVDTWEGKVIDTVTGAKTSIGSWRIPGSGALRTGQVGFIEYYAGVPSCTELPRVNVTFGAPFTGSRAVGRAGSNGEYSDCVGKTTYFSQARGRGVQVIRGTVRPFHLRNTAALRCMDNLNGTGTTPGLYDCNGGGNQAWYTTGRRELKNAGYCLDARGKRTAVGTPVDLQPCNGGRNQKWELRSNGAIVGVASGRCVAVAGNATSSYSLLELRRCIAPTSRWKRSPKAFNPKQTTARLGLESSSAHPLSGHRGDRVRNLIY